VRGDFVRVARAWLAYLGRLHRPTEIIPFQKYLDAYSSWATNDRGLSDTTVDSVRGYIKEFLRWYSALGRPLSDVRVTDIDVYLAQGAARGWQRISVCNIVGVLRRFFRFTGSARTSSTLADAIQGPRIYAYEGIPQAPSWADVRRLLGTLDPNRPADIRDRAVLMLFAIYGLRASEVAKLRLEHLDWDRDLLHVHRLKQRRTQTYPLLPSVGNALIKYLKEVRRPSAHREVFQTLRSPYCPMSRAAFYYVVATRLEALGVRSKHRGPHCLRHACATHLLADGLSFRVAIISVIAAAQPRIYAKVDMRGLQKSRPLIGRAVMKLKEVVTTP
jgi:site-specific recombinase XerD